MYSFNIDKIHSQLTELKLSAKHEQNKALLNEIVIENLERKVAILEDQLLDDLYFKNKPSFLNLVENQDEVPQIRKKSDISIESHADAFYNKLGKSFNKLMKLEEKLCNTSANIDKNKLEVKEWIKKLNNYPTRFKSFKSFYQ